MKKWCNFGTVWKQLQIKFIQKQKSKRKNNLQTKSRLNHGSKVIADWRKSNNQITTTTVYKIPTKWSTVGYYVIIKQCILDSDSLPICDNFKMDLTLKYSPLIYNFFKLCQNNLIDRINVHLIIPGMYCNIQVLQ